MDESLKEMMETKASMGSRVLAATPAQILPASDMRVALVLSCFSDNHARVWFAGAANGQTGIVIPLNGAPVILTMRDVGRLICETVWAVAGTNPSSICWAEVIHPCLCQRHGYEELH